MSPAGSGSAQFRGEPGACVDRGDLPVPDHDPPEPRGSGLTMQDVQSLLGRAQRLVDSRRSSDPVAWWVEAAHLGDLYAIGAVAAITERSTPRTRETRRLLR
jgi:hypothetical protein